MPTEVLFSSLTSTSRFPLRHQPRMQSPALQEQPTSPYANMSTPTFNTSEWQETSALARREYESLAGGFSSGLLVAAKEKDRAYMQQMKMTHGRASSGSYKFVLLPFLPFSLTAGC